MRFKNQLKIWDGFVNLIKSDALVGLSSRVVSVNCENKGVAC